MSDACAAPFPYALCTAYNVSRFIYPGFMTLAVMSILFPPGIGKYMAADLGNQEQVLSLFSNFTWGDELSADQAAVVAHWQAPGLDYFGCLFIYFCSISLTFFYLHHCRIQYTNANDIHTLHNYTYSAYFEARPYVLKFKFMNEMNNQDRNKIVGASHTNSPTKESNPGPLEHKPTPKIQQYIFDKIKNNLP
ncbi:hypothetical protein evm_015440 [Chilo suppressalis]|nr:hypothetical protein evm_015440 [Chilo suppressalis]